MDRSDLHSHEDHPDQASRDRRVVMPGDLSGLEIFDAAEAAVYLRLSTSTLAKLRMRGGGPTFIRQSARKTLYRKSDLDAWLAERARSSTSDRGEAA